MIWKMAKGRQAWKGIRYLSDNGGSYSLYWNLMSRQAEPETK